MPTSKITEKETTSSVKSAASFLITQQENVNGANIEALRRVSLSAVVEALRQNGVNDGLVTTAVLQAMYGNLVKSITPGNGNITVEYWDDSTQEITVESGGLAFDGVTYDQSTGYLHIQQDGVDVVDPCFIGGGGGGGSSGSTITITNRNASRTFSVTDSAENVNILFSASSVDSDTSAPTGNLTANWYVNGTRVHITNIEQGNGSFDVKNYLTPGATNTVKLTIEDAYGGSKSMIWTITVTSYTLSWNIEDFANHGSDSLNLRLVPNGQGNKTLKVTIDGTSIYEEVIATSGRAVAITIPAQTHGAHTILAWMEATVDGSSVSTTPLRHIGIWITSGNTTPIVAFYNSSVSASQYSTVAIKYRVYNPTSETATVTLNATGDSAKTLTVDRGTNTWAYKPTTSGTKTLSITCGDISAIATVTVTATQYDINEVTRGLIVDLNPTGHVNSESNAANFGYTDGNGTNHPLFFSSNFDWVSGGFQQDEEGITAFVIKRGCYVDLDRSFFNDNAKSSGKEIKIVFKSKECRNYDATVLTCVSDNVGLKLQAQQATLSSSLQSATVQYCEDKKIEMDINIEATAEDQLAVIWLEGIPSRGIAYEDADNWQQASPTNVRIGSDDCDVWIYRLKMYSTSLTRFEVLDNFIADCGNVTDMVERYERNDIYNTNGTINENKLSQARPELYVINITASKMTVSKKDEVICSVTLKYKNGGALYEFTATGVIMKAQGTSSLEYILAALNLDLDFSSATSWKNGNDEDITAYSMTPNSIPVNYLNIKLNVASSENANNVCMTDDYNTYQPYINPARVADNRVRDTIEGHPCAVFFTNSSGSAITAGARTIEAGETILYGVGDICNSKKNFAVFGQNNTVYPRQCCVEIGNNNNPQCRFMSDDLSTETWDGDMNFEFRYPKKPSQQNKNDWQALLSWVVSTNTAAATGNALSESFTYSGANFKVGNDTVNTGTVFTTDTAKYRASKFREEFADHFSVDSMLYHYLATERHCMVDNRAKNTFMSFEWDESAQDYRWNICKDYDNDTMAGNDNSGGLTFTYGLEDTDMVGAAYVFNAYDSVLWCNIRDYMKDELIAMFTNREAAGAWNAERIINKWKAYQSARPEALIVEDMWGKYFTPYINNNETRYIKMMLGTKEDQFRQFQTYQERYMSAKYGGSVSTSDRISLRTNAPEGEQAVSPSGNISGIIPYASTYITVKYGNAGTVRVRAARGQAYNISMPEGASLNDLETYIYSASNIASLGSLAGLYTKFVDIASATKLQQAIIGSDVENYSNTSLNSENGGISFGNNILMKKIDLRGTPNLNQGLDLSALKALEEIYTTGSGVTGVTFAQRAPLKTVQLNAVRQLIARDLTELETFSVPYTNLQTVWIDNCPLIDTKALVTSATGLTRGRLTGISWSLDNANILIRLAGLSGLDNAGNNTERFVLTGTVNVAIISADNLATIQAAFPELTVTYGSLLPSFTVSFKNYDESILNTQIIDQGSAPTDPRNLATNPVATPAQPSSVSTIYTFDGWSWTNGGALIADLNAVSITSNTVIYAHYSTTKRTYTVNWYNGTALLETITADYGAEAVYTGSIPKHASDGDYSIYHLFKGWDKSTGFITENMDVHALYDSTIPPTDKTLSQMTPEDLHALIETGVLSSTGANNTVISSGDEIDIIMGHDFDFDNVTSHELISISSPKTFDGTNSFKPQIDNEDICLFDTDKSFTLAIDFSFASDSETNCVLASSYQSNGFILKYSAGGAVRYGNAATQQVSVNEKRQMVIIRKKIGDTKLHIYASNKNGNAISYMALDQNTAPIHNAPLSFGCQIYAEGDCDNFGTGTIYWAKLYDDDLGDSVCKTLAAWPREINTVQAVGSSEHAFKNFVRQDNSRYVNCTFLMKNLLEEYHAVNPANKNEGGWKAMPIRTWLNTRILAALPIKWQQLLLTVVVNSNAGYESTTNVEPPAYDKIWIPSCKEVGANVNTSPYSLESESTFTIFTNNESRIKKLNHGCGAAASWWLRSPYPGGTYSFWYVHAAGGVFGGGNTGYSCGVAFGFCI